jgi:hypothetical protein
VRNEDAESASLLYAHELAEFLDHVGAWSVAFTSPPTNSSAAGMRMLQDHVARLRPGPILLHDMRAPGAREALSETYRFLYAGGETPASPAISLFCHPHRITGAGADEASNRLLEEYTLAGRLGEQLAGDKRTWLAASQRKLEATAGELASAAEADPDSSGRLRARRLVLEALAECAENPSAGCEEQV